MTIRISLVGLLLACMPVLSLAQASTGVFLRPWISLGEVSDQRVTTEGTAAIGQRVAIDADTGYSAGLGVGYRFASRFVLEAAWEYRNNDSAVLDVNAQGFPRAELSSSTIFINGSYVVETYSPWRPYVGVGVGWIQDLELDLKASASDLRYTSDGDVGYQLFAGMGYQISKHWSAHGELRWGSTRDIDLEAEGSARGRVTKMRYEPRTFQLGVAYTF